MNQPQKFYVACVPWDCRSRLIVTVQRKCSLCGADVALSASNVEVAAGQPLICLDCAGNRFKTDDFVGGFVGGKFYQDLHAAALAAAAEAFRRN